jgi:hypothetical protein
MAVRRQDECRPEPPGGWRARTATSGPARIAGTLAGVGCQALPLLQSGIRFGGGDPAVRV